MASKTVLIVEDELIISMLLEQMLKELGHQVVGKVSSGEEAVSVALDKEPDVILMDIQLKGEMDGIEAVSRIQKHNSVSVIYTSGNTDMLAGERLNGGSYIDFLSKPIQMSELNRTLQIA